MARILCPSTIDASGSRDVTDDLTDWLASVPDDNVAVLPRRGILRCERPVEVKDKHAFTIAGNGALLKSSPTDDGQRTNLRLFNGDLWVVKNLSISGGAPARRPIDAYVEELQWQHAVTCWGVQGAYFDNVTAADIYGDGFYCGVGSGDKPCRSVSVNHSTVKRNGRQGVAAVHVDGLRVYRSVFDSISLMPFNIEPNPGCTVSHVSFDTNQVRMSPRQQTLGVVGHGPVSEVHLKDNDVNGLLRVWLQSADGLGIYRVNVTGNTGDQPLAAGYVVDAHNVDWLTVEDNVQPLDGGQWRNTVDCTNVTFARNVEA